VWCGGLYSRRWPTRRWVPLQPRITHMMCLGGVVRPALFSMDNLVSPLYWQLWLLAAAATAAGAATEAAANCYCRSIARELHHLAAAAISTSNSACHTLDHNSNSVGVLLQLFHLTAAMAAGRLQLLQQCRGAGTSHQGLLTGRAQDGWSSCWLGLQLSNVSKHTWSHYTCPSGSPALSPAAPGAFGVPAALAPGRRRWEVWHTWLKF
jgi:hypothetical protein